MNLDILQNIPDSTISTILRKDTTKVFNYTFSIDTTKSDTDKAIISKKDTVKKTSEKKDTTAKALNNNTDTSKSKKEIKSIDLLDNDLSENKDSILSNTDTTIVLSKEKEILYKNDWTKSNSFYDSFILNIPYNKIENNDLEQNEIKTEISNIQKSVSVEKIIVRENVLIQNKEHINNSDWGIILILIFLFTLTLIKARGGKYLTDLFKSIFNFNISSRAIKESILSNQAASNFSIIIFVFSFSYFIYQVLDYYVFFNKEYLNFQTFLIISGIILTIYLLKYTVYKILGIIFNQESLHSEYIFNVFLVGRVYGIALIPIIVSIAFLPENLKSGFIYFGIFLLSILLIIRTIRGVQICLNVNFSILYTFLYLCILEILPILVLYRIISKL